MSNNVMIDFPDDEPKPPKRIEIWWSIFEIPAYLRNMISELKDTIISLLKDRWDDNDFTYKVK